MAMSARFLPWLRAARPAPGATLSFTVGATPADVPIGALGPGDIARLAPGVQVQPDPAPQSVGFPSTFFASARFTDAAFPWLFTPGAPDASGLLMPWIALVVIDEEEAPALLLQRSGGLTVLTMAAARLPAAGELSAFAHVQVSGDLPASTDLVALVRDQPGRAGARVLAAQRLAPSRRYRALLVPTFEAGRLAGLGEPVGDPLSATPAWAGDTAEVTLPVYREWSFGTGADPDIETVARRLVERSAAQWPEPPSIDLAALGVNEQAGYRGILRPLATEPAAVNDAAAQKLAAMLPAASPTSQPPPERTRVTLPWWGDGHGARERDWSRTLNLDPRLRALAGLGAELVRRRQDHLVDAFWRQAGAVLRAQRLLIGSEMAAAVSTRLVHKHFAKASAETVIHALRPAVSPTGAPRLFARGGTEALQEVVAVPPALRRVASVRRLSKAASSAPAPTRSVARSGVITAGRGAARLDLLRLRFVDLPLTPADPLFSMFSHGAPPGSPTPVSDVPIPQPAPVLIGQLAAVALQTVLSDIAERARLPKRIDIGDFAPAGSTASVRGGTALDEPLVPALGELGPQLVFPLLDALPDDSLQVLAVDGAAVEALLVGANVELVRELQWRGAPVRPDATLLANAWVQLPHPPIAEWGASGTLEAPLGGHAAHLAATVIVMNSPLLARLPGLTPWLAQAVAVGESGRRPGTTTMAPLFMHALSDEVACFGFPIAPDALAGRDGGAGWYFCFSQGPQKPRFGLDEMPVEPMRTWADLDWSRVKTDNGRLHLNPAPQPQQPAGLSFGPDGAQMAAILLQRSIRFAIHGSQLPGVGAA
jgi:hypothetical protein